MDPTDLESAAPAARPAELDFLKGGGEMGALMRAHDWSQSSLGSPSGWPQALRTVVRLLLNTGHPMYIWWGEDGACLYNDAYRESIGPERHPGSLGLPAKQVWLEIWDVIGSQIEHVLSGHGATWNVNQLIPITRHGRKEDVYWTYSYSPIDDHTAPNQIGGVLVICTETTENVLLARQATAQRDQLDQLFKQAPSFMALLTGPDHIFEITNLRYQKLVGHRAVVGKTVVDALPEVVEQGFVALLDEVYKTGMAYSATGTKFNLQAVPGGPISERYVDFVYQPIKSKDGNVSGIFVEGIDVTDRARADSALRASEANYRELAQTLADSNRLKDEFVATLAHELRNPLAPIRNALEIQRRALDDKKVIAETRDMMERQVGQMMRLIDDLLDLSRLSRDMVELRRTHFSLAIALGNAIEASRPVIEQFSHRIVISLPGEDLIVEADDARIVQIFTNLLNNAAKFTPVGGRIEVTLVRENDAAIVSIRDNGIGISKPMLNRVFDLFTQVDRSYAEVSGGLGIGLTLVRQLVERHGGQIEARSSGLGTGSEFLIRLPLAPQDKDAIPLRSTNTNSARPINRLKILLADDNVDAARSLGMILSMIGHDVRTVHDGQSALDIGSEFCPDVMVLDIAMPLLDGHAVCRQARTEQWGKHVLFIALSGWGQTEDKLQSLEAGFNHHLIKPVELESLEELLAQYTKNSLRSE
ncbi:MAG: response regulator [Verrucomicrobiaceae bacterium]|nr:response regulator [Verrucomicrobiaceae bacterium]